MSQIRHCILEQLSLHFYTAMQFLELLKLYRVFQKKPNPNKTSSIFRINTLGAQTTGLIKSSRY